MLIVIGIGQKIIRAFVCPKEWFDVLNFGCDRDALRQRIQHGLVIASAGCGSRVKDDDRAAVGLGADSPTETLPQFLLHFWHDLGLDVAV